MYKVLIVDDEKQIVDGLRRMIKWAEFGFEVCASARDGLEAIPLIKAHKPDLVLTDVRMPRMDGLKLLEYVRGNIPRDIEFIILSGFSEFQYAKKALQYNVKDYILKPIDEAPFYGALIDIKNILKEKELRNSLKIKAYINNIIMGDQLNGNELVLEDEQVYGLRYLTIARHREFDTLSACDGDPQDGEDLAGVIGEKIGNANMRFVLRQDKNKCSIVVGKSLLSRFEYDVRHLARSLCEFLWITRSIKTDVLIGKKVREFKDLHESVKTIAPCRNKQFYQNRASILTYDDIREEEFCKIYDDQGAVIRIISAFKKNDMDKLRLSVEQLTSHFASQQVVPEIALMHLDSIMASVIQILAERTEELSEVFALYSAYKKIQSGANVYELGRLAVEFCLFCNEFSLNRDRRDNTDIICKVLRYVDKNFMEPLKIADIAEHFYVNPAYLGQLFTKKKGCSLNHYLNTVRIEKAKELLANTGHKIYEIAREVGYDDPNYFSAKFYEYTCRTPSDFRNGK